MLRSFCGHVRARTTLGLPTAMSAILMLSAARWRPSLVLRESNTSKPLAPRSLLCARAARRRPNYRDP
eukprot:4101268-Prorocentrum_lima.AAC.1